MNVFTWNLQGSKASTENKWNSGIKPLALSTKPNATVCLQESGLVPESAEPKAKLTFTMADGQKDWVSVYLWGCTDRDPGFWIFFHYWDTGSNRVNTAIVTRTPPVDFGASVILMQPAGSAVWRPALGVQFGDTWLFSFHAMSGSGNDGPGLLRAVSESYPNWIVAADWNKVPEELEIPEGSIICPPNKATHPVSHPVSQYDYCVRSGTDEVEGQVITELIMSDHYAVGYNFGTEE